MAAQVNPDLANERENATFDVLKLTQILDGGAKNTERRRRNGKIVLDDKVFSGGKNYHYMSRPERYGRAVEKSAHLMKVLAERGLTSADDDFWDISQMAFPNEERPFGLNEDMFIPTLQGQGTEEQQAKWVPKARSYQIIGTYAQTEIGHGTFIRGLETTSVYDPKTEEFVIHSPTLSSTKWWPGSLGKTSDHVVLMAQLFTQGTNLGVHPFVVQIRDLKTHKPMPGVIVGDIGPKLGYDNMDNGYLRFDHVRIPRDHMLAKNSEVLRDGTYVSKAKNKRLAYGTMVFVRAMISFGQAKGLARAVTIATRYSCVRRQMELKPGAGEVQVLDYQTQQYKLLPLLATAYGFWFAGQRMSQTYYTMNEEIQKGNVDLLPELHAATSCLKAFTSYTTTYGIEACRLACGGHGYSHASGISKIYVTETPACTYEGENSVLYLQAARYLSKAYDKKNAGEQITGVTSYVHMPVNAKSSVGADLTLQSLLDAFRFRAARLVDRAGLKYNTLRVQQEQHIAWNNSTVLFCEAAEAHAQVYVMDSFVKAVAMVTDSGVRDVLTSVCQLYAAHSLSDKLSIFAETGHMTSSQIEMINEGAMTLMEKVRRNAVPLVDAFDFHDQQLGSIIGRYDGNVYEAMFDWANKSPLNDSKVHPSFNKYMKPFHQGLQNSKL